MSDEVSEDQDTRSRWQYTENLPKLRLRLQRVNTTAQHELLDESVDKSELDPDFLVSSSSIRIGRE